jgi:hypothetical protein
MERYGQHSAQPRRVASVEPERRQNAGVAGDDPGAARGVRGHQAKRRTRGDADRGDAKEKWEAAFDVVRESQHEDAHRKRGFQPDHPDVKLWLDGYMAGVRILVAEIEASGGVAGGNA